MRVVIQRVLSSAVMIRGEMRSYTGPGMLVLLGIGIGDDVEDVEWLVHKIAELRIFNDEFGVMNKNVVEAGGQVMVVSQFTLMASTRHGNRPSYSEAAGREFAIPLYETFCQDLSAAIGRPVATGEFGANMQVSLVNDGPVTICIDSKNRI